MENEPQNDVNLNVLGTGCATSCGVGCVSILLIMLIVGVAGVRAVQENAGVVFVGFLMGLAGHLVVGYVTAGAARAEKAAVNFHVLIVGGLSMILGLAGMVMPQKNQVLTSQQQSLTQLLGMISWLLTIPLMLLGASWNTEESS
jgi:hypothetical protein